MKSLMTRKEKFTVLLSLWNELSQDFVQFDESCKDECEKALMTMIRQAYGLDFYNDIDNVLNAARYSAHVEFDTNPGAFYNWFPFFVERLEYLAENAKD